jgi:Putative beta-barrel porin 2
MQSLLDFLPLGQHVMKPLIWLTAIVTVIPCFQTGVAQADEWAIDSMPPEDGTVVDAEFGKFTEVAPTSTRMALTTPVIPPEIAIAKPEIAITKPKTEIAEPKTEIAEPVTEIAEPVTEIVEPKIEIVQPKIEIAEPKIAIAEPKIAIAEPKIAIAEPKAKPEATTVKPEAITVKPKAPIRLAPVLMAQVPPAGEPESTQTAPDPLASEPLEPLDESDVRSEIGELQPFTLPTPQKSRPQPTVQLLLRSAVYTSSNITALRDFSPSDTVFVNSAMLLATPKLGESTRLIASVGGGLTKFASLGDSNYNHLSFNVALQQRITNGTYAQLGWLQENLYRAEGGDRLLRDNSLQFILGRQDQIAKKLRLDTTYDFRASFTDRDDQSRLTHSLGTRLRYDVSPKLQTALEYRLHLKDYTRVDRFDTEHQISALATYNITPDLFVAGNVSYLFGRSSNPDNNPNNLSIGISIGANIPIF